MRMWFIPIKDIDSKVTIQSTVAETYDEAVANVLKNPIRKNIVEYRYQINDKEFVWININEQN